MIERINHSNLNQTSVSKFPVDYFDTFCLTGGAPRKGEGLSKQLVVTEDEDVVHHKLFGGKRKRSAVVHDLMADVNSGKRPAKKH